MTMQSCYASMFEEGPKEYFSIFLEMSLFTSSRHDEGRAGSG